MDTGSYWSSVFRARQSRRRTLALGGAATALAFLASCGGDDAGGQGKNSGFVTQPVDTSKQARRGGVMLSSRDREVDTSDPYFRSRTQPGTALTYSRLFRQKPGYLARPPAEFIGDLADSWEFSGDRRQLTIKLKPNARWHNKAPINGRPLDAQDVVYSWDRFSKVGVNRALLANSVSPVAPIDSITAVDSRTILLKIAKPTAALLPLLSGSISGYFWLLPRESESQYDLRRATIGSGPWLVHDYQTSIHLIFKRHEGWHGPDNVYFDEVKQPIISEYSAGLAQFRAGAMYNFGVRPTDVLQTKRDVPALNLFLLEPVASADMAFFGWNPGYGAGTPFRDKRLRQAFSLSLERDLWIDTFYNVEKLRAEGLPVETAWNTVLTTVWSGWWLDPKGKEFGPNAKYFQFDLPEAKKLVSAAGFPNGVDVKAQYITTGEYGPEFNNQVETILNFARGAGFNMKAVPVGFNTDWPKISDSAGDFEGISFRSAGATPPDGAESVYAVLHPEGGSYYTGLFSPDSSYQKGDPRLNDLLERTRTEYDEKKRVSIIHEVQRLAAESQYVVRVPGSANSLSLSWPALQNEQVFQGELSHVGLWADLTKPPHKPA